MPEVNSQQKYTPLWVIVCCVLASVFLAIIINKEPPAASSVAVSPAVQIKAQLEADKQNAEAHRLNNVRAQFSQWDGSHRAVESYIKEHLKNPSSYEHVSTDYIDKGDYLIVTTVYRATNTFNAVVPESHSFKVSLQGDILQIIK
jgi:hypothetical protein